MGDSLAQRVEALEIDVEAIKWMLKDLGVTSLEWKATRRRVELAWPEDRRTALTQLNEQGESG